MGWMPFSTCHFAHFFWFFSPRFFRTAFGLMFFLRRWLFVLGHAARNGSWEAKAETIKSFRWHLHFLTAFARWQHPHLCVFPVGPYRYNPNSIGQLIKWEYSEFEYAAIKPSVWFSRMSFEREMKIFGQNLKLIFALQTTKDIRTRILGN